MEKKIKNEKKKQHLLSVILTNSIAISIVYIYLLLNPIKKTIHHAVNIMSTEAELFAIRCGINQAIQIPNVIHIIVIINAIYAAHCIFNSLIYLY